MRQRVVETFSQYNVLHAEHEAFENVEVPALHDMVFWEDEVKVNSLCEKV